MCYCHILFSFAYINLHEFFIDLNLFNFFLSIITELKKIERK